MDMPPPSPAIMEPPIMEPPIMEPPPKEDLERDEKLIAMVEAMPCVLAWLEVPQVERKQERERV